MNPTLYDDRFVERLDKLPEVPPENDETTNHHHQPICTATLISSTNPARRAEPLHGFYDGLPRSCSKTERGCRWPMFCGGIYTIIANSYGERSTIFLGFIFMFFNQYRSIPAIHPFRARQSGQNRQGHTTQRAYNTPIITQQSGAELCRRT